MVEKAVYRNSKRIYPQPRCQASRDVRRLQYTHCKRGTLQTTGVCETLLADVVATPHIRMIVANVATRAQLTYYTHGGRLHRQL